MQIENARQSQARDLAALINLAGEGIPFYLWRNMREHGESELDVGARRAANSEGSFSYRHVRVCMQGDALMAMLLAYRLPASFDLAKLNDFPEVVRPLVRLESAVPQSWYINAVASFTQFRGRGAAKALLYDAFEQGLKNRCTQCSLIVSSLNQPAYSLYSKLGFELVSALPSVPLPEQEPMGEWLLLARQLAVH